MKKLPRSLLTVADTPPAAIQTILAAADNYLSEGLAGAKGKTLRGKFVINMFFESSTRTRVSFELAAQRLGAEVVNITPGQSSIKKGETLLDTAHTLAAMDADVLVVRHPQANTPKMMAEHISRYGNCHVVNGGDGSHAHPTQAIADALTIKRRRGRIDGLKIAICGDVAHSRVARSNVVLLKMLGADLRLIGPDFLMPRDISCPAFNDLERGLKDCDIVMMLRLQKERLSRSEHISLEEYKRLFCLTRKKLAAAGEGVLVMHPGPINRNIEIEESIADDISRSLIYEQVKTGVAVRMACLEYLVAADG